MEVPGIVRDRLADERRMTSVNVGGDDRVYVTPPKTLVYHASGLFSSEEIEEYSHEARRFDVSADRREASFAFEYDDGVRGFSVPQERIETILPPILAGVLRMNGLIEDEEAIEESYRFGDRTLVVAESQLLTSVGEAIWDRDHESYEYEHVTDLQFEGDLIIEVDGRSRRIELDGDGRREAYETVEDALLSYHGIASIEELPGPQSDNETTTSPRRSSGEATESTNRTDATEPKPIENAEPDSEQHTTSSTEESLNSPIREATESNDAETEMPAEAETPNEAETPVETTPERDETTVSTDELDALRENVERQIEILEEQQETLEQLVETLDATDDQ